MIKKIKKLICKIFGHKQGDKLYVGQTYKDMGDYTLVKKWCRICPRCEEEIEYELKIERKGDN